MTFIAHHNLIIKTPNEDCVGVHIIIARLGLNYLIGRRYSAHVIIHIPPYSCIAILYVCIFQSS